MAEFVSRDKAAEFSLEDLRSPEGRSGLLCISQSTWMLAYSLVIHYGYWRSRYYKLDVDGSMLQLDDNEWEEVTDIVDLAVEELSMTGCEEFITALGDISAQIGTVGAAINGVSLQIGEVNASLISTGQTSACCSPYGAPIPADAPDEGEEGVDPPPEGFSTWAEYWTYKCEAANKIADDWIDTIGNLATLSGMVGAIGAIAMGLFLQTSLLSGLLTGLMVIGFSAATAAAIVIGALVALIAGGVGLLAYFVDLAGDMETDKQSLVCDLYNSTSVAGAKSIVLAFTSDKALGLTYDPGDDAALFQDTVSTIADALFSAAVINSLFTLDADVQGYVGDIDCAACVPDVGCLWDFHPGPPVRGTGDLTKDGNQRTLTAVNYSGSNWQVAIQLDTLTGSPGQDCDGETTINAAVDVVSYSISEGSFSTRQYGVWEAEQYNLYTLPAVPVNGLACAFISLVAQQSFTVDIVLYPGNIEG